MPHDRALSEVVSIILIGALVIILALVTISMIFGNLTFQQKSALIVADMKNETIANKNTFVFFHRAGDEVYLNASLSGFHEMAIYIDNRTASKRVEPVLGVNTIKPGTTLYIYYNASKNIYRVTTSPAILATNEAQPITDCPVRVRLVDETAHLLITTWNWTCTPLPLTGPAPTITSRIPSSGNRGWPVTVTIRGTNFLPGATAKLNRTDGIPPEIAATSCSVDSSTMMNCTFSLPSNPLAPLSQRYNLVVINPDGKRAMRTNYFRVYSRVPTISSSTPSSSRQATTVAITRLRGNYFQPGATVIYWQGATIIPLTGVTVVNVTSITGTLTIPSNAPIGYYNVTVYNIDNRNVTRASRFRVLSNAPTVTRITNRTGYRGWTVIENITGTNFVDGATARFNGTGLADVAADSCTYVSSTSLYCTFNLLEKDASPTYGYNIVVTNPDGKEGMRASYFTLSSPSPTISGSTPSSGVAGTSVPITNLRGNYFQPGAVVTYWHGNPLAPDISITLGSVDVPVRTQVTGSLSIPAGAPTGYYNITVENTDGKSVTRRNRFRVWGVPAPTISAIDPGTGGRGAGVPVIVTGTNIRAGARIRLYDGNTRIYTAPLGTVTPPDTIATTFNVPLTVLPGTMNVRVTNPDGQYAILTGGYVLT